jgi:hypothetical protein
MVQRMVRTQIQLTETQLQALRARSQRDRMSISELVGQAVGIAGQFASGRQDVVEYHDAHLAELFRQ